MFFLELNTTKKSKNYFKEQIYCSLFKTAHDLTMIDNITKNLGSPVLIPQKQLESNEFEFEGCWGAKNLTPDWSNCTSESRVAPQPYPWPKLSNHLLDSSSVTK
jgi:hypothetical protein